MIEVAPASNMKPVASSSAEKLNSKFSEALAAIKPMIGDIATSIHQAATSVDQALQSTKLTNVEVKLGLGITVEGKLFVAKAEGKANFDVTLKFKLGDSDDGAEK